MARALAWIVALAALCAAALFVPIAGKSLWERTRARPKQTAKARPRIQRKAPEEKITKDDRVALDALVAGAR